MEVVATFKELLVELSSRTTDEGGFVCIIITLHCIIVSIAVTILEQLSKEWVYINSHKIDVLEVLKQNTVLSIIAKVLLQ
jgi:hypothetical protein